MRPGNVYAHMGNGKTTHLVQASAHYGDVLVSILAKCGSPYLGPQTLDAVNCKNCLKTVAAQQMRVRQERP